MRARVLASNILVLVALAVNRNGAPHAQVAMSLGVPLGWSSGVSCGIAFMPPLMLGLGDRSSTYTATMRSTYEQRLADGNVIHQSRDYTSARDGDGRTMQQSVQGCEAVGNGENGPRTQVSVSDPKAKTTLTWIVGQRSTHIAYLRHNPEMRTDTHPLRPPQLETLPKRTSPGNDPISEQLGTRNIAGVEATGTRWTRIIPSGSEGNDLPIKTVRETWSSQKPRMELMVVEDDPRIGHRQWEVTSLSLSAPDPSLFAPPQGYTVEEGTPIVRSAAKGSPDITGSSTSTSTTPVLTPPQSAVHVSAP